MFTKSAPRPVVLSGSFTPRYSFATSSDPCVEQRYVSIAVRQLPCPGLQAFRSVTISSATLCTHEVCPCIAHIDLMAAPCEQLVVSRDFHQRQGACGATQQHVGDIVGPCQTSLVQACGWSATAKHANRKT